MSDERRNVVIRYTLEVDQATSKQSQNRVQQMRLEFDTLAGVISNVEDHSDAVSLAFREFGNSAALASSGLADVSRTSEQTERGVNAVRLEFSNLEGAIRGVSPAADSAVNALRQTATASGQVAQTTRDVTQQTELAARATREYAQELARAQDARSRLSARQEQFDLVSRDVQLAGDVQSNLGALRGLSGLAGQSNLATGLDVAGEVAALTEELPRLKTALSGFPDTIGAAISAIGPAGLAAGAGLTAAIVGLAAVADHARRAFEENEEAFQRAVDSINAYHDALQIGTEEGIASAIDAAEAEIQRLEDIRDEIIQRGQEASNAFFEATGNRLEEYTDFLFNTISGVSMDENVRAFAAAREDLQENAEAIEEQRRAIDGYTEALDSSELQTQRAQEATQQLFGGILDLANRTAEGIGELNQRNDEGIIRYENILREAREMSAESIQEQIDATREEIEFKRHLIENTNISFERTQELSREIGTLSRDLAAWREALPAGELRDTTEATIEFANSLPGLVRGFLAGVEENARGRDSEIVERFNLLRRAEQMTADEIDNTIQQLEREIEYRRTLINSGELTAFTVSDMNDQIRDMTGEIDLWKQALPDAELRATTQRTREFAQSLFRDLGEVWEEAQERQQALNGIAADVRKSRADMMDAIQGIAAELQQSLSEAAAQRDQELAKLEQGARDQRLDARQKYNDAMIDAQRDFIQRSERIQEQYYSSAARAIDERNGQALKAAQEQAEQEQKDAVDAREEARRRTQQVLDRTLNDVRVNLQRRRVEVHRSYQQEVNDLRQAANAKRQQQMQAYQQEVMQAQQQRTRLLQVESEKNTAIVNFARRGLAAMQQIFSSMQFSSASGSRPSSGSGGIGGLISAGASAINNALNSWRNAAARNITPAPSLQPTQSSTTIQLGVGLSPRQASSVVEHHIRNMQDALLR